MAFLARLADLRQVAALLRSVGPLGIGLVLPYLAATTLYAVPWALLLPARLRPGWGAVVTGRFATAAVNVVLPTGLLGEPLRLRGVRKEGWPAAGEALAWDRALYLVATALFLAGTAAAAARLGHLGAASAALLAALGSLGWAVVMLGATRIPRLRTIAARLVRRPPGDQASASPLRPAPSSVLAGVGLHLLGRVALAGEIWLAAALLGHALGIEDGLFVAGALVLTGVALPIVPGQLGVQEAALAGAMMAVGQAPETGVALALLIRARQLVFVPVGLLLAIRGGGLEGRTSLEAGPR